MCGAVAVFASPIFGGQAAFGVTSFLASVDTTLSGTLFGSLGPFGFTATGSGIDDLTAAGDLYPMFSLRWNQGTNNFMTYVTGDMPVGTYSPTSLSNVGIGHYAIDAGAGYTYFNSQTGHELSAVAGFNYNFINPYTAYQNGVDFHLDWGVSQFLSDQVQVCLVGYLYDQVTGDSGAGDRVAPFQSRVVGIGPQIGYIFPVFERYQGYLNLKGYGKFDAAHRPSGWNAWLTFVISNPPPGRAPPPSAQPRSMITK